MYYLDYLWTKIAKKTLLNYLNLYLTPSPFTYFITLVMPLGIGNNNINRYHKILYTIFYFIKLTITRQFCRTRLGPSGLGHRIASQILLFRFASNVSDLHSVATSRRTLHKLNGKWTWQYWFYIRFQYIFKHKTTIYTTVKKFSRS